MNNNNKKTNKISLKQIINEQENSGWDLLEIVRNGKLLNYTICVCFIMFSI
jgi:hypothetical protein